MTYTEKQLERARAVIGRLRHVNIASDTAAQIIATALAGERAEVAEECARIVEHFDHEFSNTSSLLDDIAAAISARFG